MAPVWRSHFLCCECAAASLWPNNSACVLSDLFPHGEQELFSRTETLDINQPLWTHHCLSFLFFFLSFWIMLGWALPLLTFSCVLPPVVAKQRWQALYVTERGGCHQSSSIKTFVISPVSEGMFPGFTAAFMTSSLITSQRNESRGNELIRVPVTNTIFVCCCQVAEKNLKSRNMRVEKEHL